MALKKIIVGWARGGLGYVTELLKSSGREVGTTFGPDTTLENLAERVSMAKEYEVSPYLIPFLGHKPFAECRTSFVLRDPMRVLNSLYFHGMFHNERSSDVSRSAFAHLPGFRAKFAGKPGQASCAYIWNWFRTAQKNSPKLEIIRVEEGPGAIRRYFGLSEITQYVPPYTNVSYCKQTIVPSVLPPASRDGMVRLLTELGYRETYWAPRGGHAHYVNPDWHC